MECERQQYCSVNFCGNFQTDLCVEMNEICFGPYFKMIPDLSSGCTDKHVLLCLLYVRFHIKCMQFNCKYFEGFKKKHQRNGNGFVSVCMQSSHGMEGH